MVLLTVNRLFLQYHRTRLRSLSSLRAMSSPRKRPKKAHVKISSEAPENWEEVYDNILEMRKNRDAPVDSMGCERAHDPDAEPKVRRFQCLVSLMLSSQTKDEVNFAAMTRLKERGLTPENIVEMSDKELGELIYPVGFWKVS